MASAKDSDDVRARLGQLRRYLEKRYGISIVDLNRLDRGVYRVDRKEGQSWVARIFPAERSVDQAEGDADVLRFLEQHRFPAERCARPDPVSAPGGRAVLLTDYIEGTTAGRSEATLFKMGEMLGRLNVLPAGSGGVSREAGALHHYSLRGGPPRKELDAAASWLEEIEEEVPAANRAPYDSLREQLASADDCHGLPETLVHPDPVPKNFIVSRESELVMIDWTGAGKGPRLAPLAVLIWACGLGNDGWSPDRVDSVVAGYRSRVRLRRDELARLGAAMRIRPLVFACWRYRHAVVSGKSPDGREWWMPSDDLVESISARALAAFDQAERPRKR